MYFSADGSCDPVIMYNERSVKEKEKRCLLDLAKDDIFLYSHNFFFSNTSERFIQKNVAFELTPTRQEQRLDYY